MRDRLQSFFQNQKKDGVATILVVTNEVRVAIFPAEPKAFLLIVTI